MRRVLRAEAAALRADYSGAIARIYADLDAHRRETYHIDTPAALALFARFVREADLTARLIAAAGPEPCVS